MAEPQFPPSEGESPPRPGQDPRILGPIPTPPAQRWREVRLIYLPRTVFGLGVLVAIFLWSKWVAPAALVAEAEIEQADVRSAQAGVVASLKVDMLQPVRRGDILGQIVAVNPRILDATLSVIRADVAMARRVDLATLRGRLQQAESQFTRNAPLHKAGLITDENFEQLKTDRDALTAQVEEQARLVGQMEPIVRSLAPRDEKDPGLASEPAVDAAIKVQDAKLKLAEEQLTPSPLIAPIDGVVSAVLRRPGENVTAGEAVMRVSATRSERLTGFLRAPFSFDPKPGMIAEVRTRNGQRQLAATKITEVGAAMEAMPPDILAALRLPVNPPPEHALRIQLAMPTGLALRPGEIVDVIVH